jgi:hypothetical protein
MSQKPKFTHSAPLTADALAALFDALALCDTTRDALNEARAIIGENGGVDSDSKDFEVAAEANVKHTHCDAVPSLQVS